MALQRVIVVGNVDDGKSTLVGRLLFESRQVMEDQLSSLEKVSRARGRGELDLTLITDGLRAEREQGVTIDVAYRHFTLGSRRFLLIDAPGHVQYTRNMFTGATNADVAMILVDVSRGFTDQTFRHCLICGMLGIRDVILVLNKMDLMGYSEETYTRFREDAARRLNGLVSIREIVPISALNGDGVIERAETSMPWYKGPTVVDALNSSDVAAQPSTETFAMPVQGVESVRRADGSFERWITGRLWSGGIAVGEKLQILPQGLAANVEALRIGNEDVSSANAGDSVALRISDGIEISRGDLLAAVEAEYALGTRLNVRLFWMAKTPLKMNSPYLILQGRRKFQAMLSDLQAVYDVQALETKSSASLEQNEMGIAAMSASVPMVSTQFKKNRLLGSFVVVDPASKNSVAGGIVI